MPYDLPNFDEPNVLGMPQGCAWGLFDKNGKKDLLGTINLLTPEVVRAALSEARDSISISLNWPIGAIATPGYARKGLVHKVISWMDSPLQFHGYDDEIEVNTQCSSRWDSLVHFHHQLSESAYNGFKPSVSLLEQNLGKEDLDKALPTLNRKLHSRGGLVARGVFIDFKRWANKHYIQYSPFEAKRITINDIEMIAEEQSIVFKTGDVFIIRTSFTEALGQMDAEQQQQALRDAIAFEAMPPLINGKEGEVNQLVLHQDFLGLFGLPIGELWDLQALPEHCASIGRYTFLLTSSPLNVPGSTGSPPNALAIF
ncbi:hypothetical protein EJ08DRAFT_673788 [Tothia fuscella]|uniref:Cyclase n=1 Tax=Tothia fuscella TaxID=1048955 RepID=A0A9P4NE07_9PEZI|nr:hypothetical protein EJ08DRAFT_673788 [Tothia fuscella]